MIVTSGGYQGDIRLGDTVDVKFSTSRFSTGASFTLGGTPVVSAYVGNSTTEITSGVTLTVDFDGVTGLHNVRVVASGGNGFAVATNVTLVITTGTVDSVSVVGVVVGSFSIENRSPPNNLTLKSLNITQDAGAGDALTIKGGDASGATAGGHGIKVTGGTASTTGGGIAGKGAAITGGSGAASTNGPGAGITCDGGTVTTVAGANAATFTGSGTNGTGLTIAGGSGGGVGLSVSSPGVASVDIVATAGQGIRIITAGASSDGIQITTVGRHGINLGAGGNGNGLNLAGAGTGHPISDSAIVSTTFAAGAITATVIADGTIDRATFAADTGLQTVRSNTCQSGSTSTTIKLDASASATNNFYTGMGVYLTANTGAGQCAAIISYDGSTKVATIAGSWVGSTPDNTTTFAIIPALYGCNTIMFL